MLKPNSKGFTLVELVIVITIIGILASIARFAYNGTSQRSVNTQLVSDSVEAADLLELDFVYNKQYPTLASEVNGGKGFKLTPGTNINYVVGSAKAPNDWFCIETMSNKPGTKQYYTVLDSRPMEGTCPEAPSIQIADAPSVPAAPVVNAVSNASTTDWQWDAATCDIGTAKYEYTYTENSTSGQATTTTATNITTNTSTVDFTYSIKVRARCEDGAAASAWSNYGTDTYTRSNVVADPDAPSTPSVPSVNVATSGSTSTWSWAAVVCDKGSPVYEYTYSSSVSTGTPQTITATSIAFNTSTQGYTYTVKVRARCENGTAVSGWSSYGSKQYTRAITNTVQVAGGSNSLYVPDSNSYQINGRANVTGISGSCASGTKAVARYMTQLNQGSNIDRGGYVNLSTGWTVYYNYDLDDGDMLEIKFYARCYNATTNTYGPYEYSDAYGNLHVTENRGRPNRGTWRRGCEGHSSSPVQAGWCTADNYTFVAFP